MAVLRCPLTCAAAGTTAGRSCIAWYVHDASRAAPVPGSRATLLVCSRWAQRLHDRSRGGVAGLRRSGANPRGRTCCGGVARVLRLGAILSAVAAGDQTWRSCAGLPCCPCCSLANLSRSCRDALWFVAASAGIQVPLSPRSTCDTAPRVLFNGLASAASTSVASAFASTARAAVLSPGWSAAPHRGNRRSVVAGRDGPASLGQRWHGCL